MRKVVVLDDCCLVHHACIQCHKLAGPSKFVSTHLVLYLLWAYPFHCAAEVCLLAVHLPENVRLSEFFSFFELLILVCCRCFNNDAVLPSIRIALNEIVVQVAGWDVRCKLVKSNDLVLFGERRLLLDLA